ncbi:MAG TPA: PAS domain S-box protein [Opitutaceae bacterium]|nr:PAS domain S-box protein [Opitutaceae bacterium]
MSDAALQLPEPPPAAALPAISGRGPAATEDYCLLVRRLEDAAMPRLDMPPAIQEAWGHDDFSAALQDMLRRGLQGERRHLKACYLLARAGRRHFEVSIYPAPEASPPQAALVVRDVTERIRAESHLQLLLQIVHHLGVSPDLATATTSILKRMCLAAGWPLGEVWLPTPDGSLELFAAAHRPEADAAAEFQRETAGMTLRPRDGLLEEGADGEPLFFPALASDPAFLRAKPAARAGFRAALVLPLRSGGQMLALAVFFLAREEAPDSHWTALVRAVGAELGTAFQRERMQEQLDSFFNRSLDMHCVAGFDGYLKRVNPAWTRILGYSAEELLSRPLIEFVDPDDRAAFLEHLARLGAGEDLTAAEVRCVAQDGSTRWTLWGATSLPGQQRVLATIRDISERKRTEAAMLQSEEHYRDLFHQAYQMQENLRRMSERVLKVQEQERARISRDLHDEVGQALTAINVNLAVLRNSLVGGPPELERRISETQALIEQTMGSIHNFSRELRPAMIDDLGLLPALRNYVKSFTDRTGVAVQLHGTQWEHIERLDSDRKTVVYRIVQEGLNNVGKHAAAKRAEIILAGSNHDVRLQLNDDGRGFALDARQESASARLGLLGLAERVRLVGGEFSIASVPGNGTILRAVIPFKSP